MPDEAPSVGREEAEYADSAPVPSRQGILEDEESVQRLFGREDEIVVEWVEEGEDVREAYPDKEYEAAVYPSEKVADLGTKDAAILGAERQAAEEAAEADAKAQAATRAARRPRRTPGGTQALPGPDEGPRPFRAPDGYQSPPLAEQVAQVRELDEEGGS